MLLIYDDLIGKPFRDFGRGPDFYDCYGVCIEVSNRGGKPIPDYGSLPCDDAEGLREKFREHMYLVEKVQIPRILTLVHLRGEDGPTHMGIVVDDRSYLTTTRKTGVIKIDLNHHIWKHLMKGFYHWKPSLR